MIKINKDFSISHDPCNWELTHTRDAIDKKTKEPTRSEYKTWYPTLEKTCQAILDKSCKDAKNVDEILDTMARIKKEIAVMCEGIKKEDIK